MAEPLWQWEEGHMSDFVKEIMKDNFHAVNFDVDGVHYDFAGWWILGWSDDDYKIYDSKEEFINDPIFGGKTIEQVTPENVDFEFQAW